jgi:hypothetical protein
MHAEGKLNKVARGEPDIPKIGLRGCFNKLRA